MIVNHCFRIKRHRGLYVSSPDLSAEDMRRLQALFPHNEVWVTGKNRLSRVEDNVRYVTGMQAKALYLAITKLYAEKGISTQAYRTGEEVRGALLVSSLESVCNILIDFFEKEFGFKTLKSVSLTIADKRRAQKNLVVQASKHYAAEALVICAGLRPLRQPVGQKLRKKLEDKLGEYEVRIKRFDNAHPDLRSSLNGFQDTTYKILIATAVLNLPQGKQVSLADLASSQLEKFGDKFDARIFLSAAGVIASYILTPIFTNEISFNSCVERLDRLAKAA